MRPLSIVCIALGLLLLMTSCATQNLFLKDADKSVDTSMEVINARYGHVIKMDDKITVSIWNHDDLSVGSLFGIYNSNEVYGKWVLVNKDGEVSLPKIGIIKLGGLTKKQAEDTLTTIYAKTILNPVVVVKVINREVTVLGEVKNPGNYVLDKENNTVLELVGRAGGFDFYANKKLIQVVRGYGPGAKTFMLDFTSLENYKQNNLNLQSGDIISIPTRQGKFLDKKAPGLIPFASLLTGIVVLLKFLSQ